MGWEALLEGPRGFGKPSQRFGRAEEGGRGQKALLEGLEGVGRSSRRASRGRKDFLSGKVERPSWRTGLGREAVPKGRKGLGGSVGAGRPYWMDRRDLEALPEGRKGSGGPPEGTESIWRPIKWAVRSREWLGSSPGGV